MRGIRHCPATKLLNIFLLTVTLSKIARSQIIKPPNPQPNIDQSIFKLSLQKQINQKDISLQKPLNQQMDYFSFDDQVDNGVTEIPIKIQMVIPESDISYDQYVYQYKNNDYKLKDPEVMLYRATILDQNIRKIKQHNSQPDISYVMGLTPFTDLTNLQFSQSIMSPPSQQKFIIKTRQEVQKNIIQSKLQQIDWSCHDSTVFNQGTCSSHYILSTLGAIQLTMKIHDKKSYLLSIQEILSCGGLYDQLLDGCAGGAVQSVFKYVKEYGVGSGHLYAYSNQAKFRGYTNRCSLNLYKSQFYKKSKVFIQNYGRVAQGDCSQLVHRLRFRALSVSVDSSLFFHYKSGYIHQCQKVKLNHSVLLIGYEPSNKLYKIKNSWGSNWGLKGYAFVTDSVGICQQAYYPIFKKQKVLPTPCKIR